MRNKRRSSRTLWVGLGALALLVSGCAEPKKTTGGPAAARAASPPKPADELSRAKQLALAPAPGGALVDRNLSALQRLARAMPQKADVWAELARVWLRKARESSDPGYYLHADGSAQVALVLAPEHRVASEVRAAFLLEQHRFREARDAAEALLAREPDEAAALGTLSDAELELGSTERATEMVRRMLLLKPNLPSYSRASYLAWLHGDFSAALENLRLAIDAGGAPDDKEARAWCLVQAALLFWGRGDVAGAAAGFQQALDVSAGYPPALVGQGKVALSRGEHRRAAELFRAAFRRSPLVETADLLAQALAAGGDPDGARAAFESAEAEGRRGDARGLSLLYSTRGLHVAEALELAQQERARRADIYTEDALAWALYRAGQVDQALAASERALRHGTKDARLLFHRGAILMAAGRRAQGKQLLQSALELNPHFDVLSAREARELVERT